MILGLWNHQNSLKTMGWQLSQWGSTCSKWQWGRGRGEGGERGQHRPRFEPNCEQHRPESAPGFLTLVPELVQYWDQKQRAHFRVWSHMISICGLVENLCHWVGVRTCLKLWKPERKALLKDGMSNFTSRHLLVIDLDKEEEDGKVGSDRHSNVELHCLHLGWGHQKPSYGSKSCLTRSGSW